MNPQLLLAVAAVITALVGAGGFAAYFGTRLTNRTTREGQFTDDQAKALDRVDARLEQAEERLDKMSEKFRLMEEHALDLRALWNPGPNPRPPWPAGLTGGGVP